ncbi:MAG TPA: branched-chain amino acid ABC transporter permease [Treponemataceae bacterium]|nr:branched-chain amino acid ABC transporter permease [Treponemataceae bacterium]
MNKNKTVQDILKSLKISLWFVALLFPLTVMKVSVSTGIASVRFRWAMMPVVAIVSFILAFVWNKAQDWNTLRSARPEGSGFFEKMRLKASPILNKKPVKTGSILAILLFIIVYPHLFGMYHTNIMITALIYVILALGLNIHVGLGGLLNLGYAAFFAVGAYTYGLLWKYVGPVFLSSGINPGWLFWIALPLAGILATLFGIILSLPVLRLKGDYLAIITLAFGEIVRMFLQNSGDLTGGASGISLIPRPWFFDKKLSPVFAATYIYYIAVVLVIITIFVVRRIEDSRVGRALEAMRDDEVACEAMGVNLVKNKLITFALGAFWAGIAGVLLAAQTTFINPDSFTLWESIMILMAVVIGGTGSIPGAIAGALILKLLPEYFRALSQYRMLIYGVAMIVIIIFKPDGLFPRNRKKYTFHSKIAEDL